VNRKKIKTRNWL